MTTIKSKEEALEEEVERLLKEMRKIPMVLIRDEKRYSEEDMIDFALFLEIHLPMKPRKTHRQLLEQFKKK